MKKLDYDKKLLTYSLYVIFTVISIFIAVTILYNTKNILLFIYSIVKTIFSLIKPLIIAFIIAYLLYPITKLIEKFLTNNKLYIVKKKETRRIISILSSYILVLGIIVAIIWGIYFMIGGQLSRNTSITNVINDIQAYVSNNSISTSNIANTINSLNIPYIDNIKPYLIDLINSVQNYVVTNLGNMTSNIVSIGSSIMSFFIAFIISIYLLKDSEYFIDLWKKLYFIIFRNSKTGKTITKIFSIIHDSFSKFIRGQFLEAVCVGLLSTIALAIVGIEYAAVIGVIAGICNMIPYVGPIAGTVLAGIMALLSGNPIKIIYAIIAMLIVQQIDNNILAPKIVGDSVGLHAVFTMLAIIIGGNIGGLFGMLLAVPIAASMKVMFSIWYSNFTKKYNSK